MMFDQMKKLMEMKRQAESLKRELDSHHIEVTSTPGVKIVINGAQRFQSIELDFSVLDRDNTEQLQKILLKSVNAAIERAQAEAAQKMKNMTGLNIPGF